MLRVTAATSYLGNEGMWRAGESKVVSKHRAHELIEQGWVIESTDQAKLEAADAEQADEPGPVTNESIRKPKKKKPGDDRETKPEETATETT